MVKHGRGARAPEQGGKRANTATTPQRSQTSGTESTRDADSRELELPHERDESAVGEASAGQDPARVRTPIAQGEKDLASGRQDTDCYNAADPRYRKAEARGRNRR